MSGPEIDFHCPKHGTFCEQDHCTDCRYEGRIDELNLKIATLEADKATLGARLAKEWALIRTLEKQLAGARLARDHFRMRYMPCPDHRDKHSTGDECLMCQVERLQRKLAAANACERPAFEAGWKTGWDASLYADIEHDWQKYRSRDDTDRKAVEPQEEDA